MLFVAVVTLMSQAKPRLISVELVISILGVVLTLIWWYVNSRQSRVIDHLRLVVEDAVPTYRAIRKTRPRAAVSSVFVLVHLMPAVIGVSWLLVLLFGTLLSPPT
jgi:hypothetical protein